MHFPSDLSAFERQDFRGNIDRKPMGFYLHMIVVGKSLQIASIVSTCPISQDEEIPFHHKNHHF
jgi:hypothetical protein